MIPSRRTVSANCPALPRVIWPKYCRYCQNIATISQRRSIKRRLLFDSQAVSACFGIRLCKSAASRRSCRDCLQQSEQNRRNFLKVSNNTRSCGSRVSSRLLTARTYGRLFSRPSSARSRARPVHDDDTFDIAL